MQQLPTYPPWTMGDWKISVDKIKELLKSKNLSAAKEELAIGLEKIPNQLNLLTIATDIFRASGDREKSLEYSELLITHHPDNPPGYIRSAQDLVVLKRFEDAQEKVLTGLEKFPNQFSLLVIATDIFRASDDREKSLEYSELLITHHPDNPPGYIRSAQDLVVLKRFEDAQEKVLTGLEKFPNQFSLLVIATDIFRASGDREKSLEYSELLITHHPDNPPGYIRSAQDLVVLKRFEDAQEKVLTGLEKFPNQFSLLVIATDIFRASGDREKSLEYSELLITHHPDEPPGHAGYFKGYINNSIKEAEKAAKILLLKPGKSKDLTQTCLEMFLELLKYKTKETYVQDSLALNSEIESEWGRNFATLLNYAKIYAAAGDSQKAELALCNGLDHIPNNEFIVDTAINLSHDLCLHKLAYAYALKGRRKFGFKNPVISKSIFRLLTSLGRTDDALDSIKEFTNENTNTQLLLRKSDFLTAHKAITTFDHENSPLSEAEKEAIGKTGLYGFLMDGKNNPDPSRILKSCALIDVIFVHVGKCAGGSILHALRSNFREDIVKVWEYHCFDANHLLADLNDLVSSAGNRIIAISTRDPIARFVSSYNWDYYLNVLKRSPSSRLKIDCWYEKFSSISELVRALDDSPRMEEAQDFIHYKQHGYGHMRMGISWYLPYKTLINFDPHKTFCLRLENLDYDLIRLINHLSNLTGFAEKKSLNIIKDKTHYDRLVPQFNPNKTLRTEEKDILLKKVDFLKNDYKCHHFAINNFTDQNHKSNETSMLN